MRTSGKVEQILKEVDKYFGKKILKNWINFQKN
jgi:hypothetical protein